MKSTHSTLLVLVFAASHLQLQAVEWTQYRGPAANGTSPEKWKLTAFPSNGLPRTWQAKAETGFSSFTVADGKAFTIVGRQIDGVQKEVLVALNAKDGSEQWAAPFGIARYDKGGDRGTSENSGGDGPRSTPSFNDGRVYVYSSGMKLACFDAKDANRFGLRRSSRISGARISRGKARHPRCWKMVSYLWRAAVKTRLCSRSIRRRVRTSGKPRATASSTPRQRWRQFTVCGRSFF